MDILSFYESLTLNICAAQMDKKLTFYFCSC